ncbi:MAG: SMP-30/gluconolactonase/LRE family protein, partial [Deltaproteobacteria bacterium]|nr:SMP-30/gluconolactonase/LRE family protein [Deltaproteobacteria bacterium]
RLPTLEWVEAKVDAGGLVDVARLFGRLGPEPDAVLAKAVLRSETDRLLKVNLGYSDEVTVYLNGTPFFHGSSAYRQRDPSFLGIVGLFDAVYLPLKKGVNELTLLLTEAMGGWGFVVQDATAVFEAPGVGEAWKTPADFPIPETVVYDPSSGDLFVSGYDGYDRSADEGRQFLSRLSPDGKILSLRWVEGLRNPLGLAVAGGTLWAVETGGVVEIEIASGTVLRRIAVPSAVALNDIAVGKDGTVYLSDPGANALFRIVSGKAEEWLKGVEIARPNGLHLLGGRLIVGNNGDGRVKSVDLETKGVRTVADLGAGIIDGIESDGTGNLLVTHNEGRLFRITPSGAVTKLLDTSVRGVPLANFAWIAGKGLAVFPTFTENRVMAFRLPPG